MDISELIIKLVDGELSDKEKEALKTKLYNNPKLMQEYLTHTQLNDFLKKEFNAEFLNEVSKMESAEEKSFKAEEEALEKGVYQSTIDDVKEWKEEKKKKEYLDELKEFASAGLKEGKQVQAKSAEKQTNTGKIVLVKKWYYMVAAIAAVLTISFLIVKYGNSDVSKDELFARNYQPYHFVTEQTRSTDSTVDSLVNTATELYKSANYKEALELTTNVLAKNNLHVKARFITGLTLIEAKDYTMAADEFEQILITHDSYHLESKWYLSLCYLKLDKTVEAKKLIKELTESKNLYQKKAKKLLEVLK